MTWRDPTKRRKQRLLLVGLETKVRRREAMLNTSPRLVQPCCMGRPSIHLTSPSDRSALPVDVQHRSRGIAVLSWAACKCAQIWISCRRKVMAVSRERVASPPVWKNTWARNVIQVCAVSGGRQPTHLESAAGMVATGDAGAPPQSRASLSQLRLGASPRHPWVHWSGPNGHTRGTDLQGRHAGV